MITEQLDEMACLYALGALSEAEKSDIQARLAADPELRARADQMMGVAAALAFTVPSVSPSASLKERIFRRIEEPAERVETIDEMLRGSDDPVVVTDGDGLVSWVNSAFESMCGYAGAEVRGRKPGHMLQGAKTDPSTAARLREAVRAGRPCCEEIINYRKNGEPYWVAISITPILDVDRKPRCFVAFEREIADRLVPA
jgi:PAS domain S-box-containing protein